MPRSKPSLRQLTDDKKTILRIVKSQPCVDCGKTYPTAVMDFDHRDPADKQCCVSRLMARPSSVTRLIREMAKCDLVCSNCHRIRTHGGRSSG